MIYLSLGFLIAVCAIGWWSRYMSTAILLRYMDTKNYTLPTNEDLKACSDYVVRHTLRDIFKKRDHF